MSLARGRTITANVSVLRSGIVPARLFSMTPTVMEADVDQYKKQLDQMLYYEKTPLKLKRFVYRPKHAERVFRAELFDKETGRPLRPTRYLGPPKISLLNRYLSSIETFEELVVAKEYIRSLDEAKVYLQPVHLINFLIKSGELEKASFGLKAVYNLNNFQFTEELVRFIYLLRLLKFESMKVTDFELLNRKLAAPSRAGHEVNAADPILNLLSYTNYCTILQNGNFEATEAFKQNTEALIPRILELQVTELPQGYENFSTGKKLALYSDLKLEHAYLKKSALVVSQTPEEFVPAELKSLVSGTFEPFVSALDDLIYNIEGHQDFLTDLESRLKFPVTEEQQESSN